MFFGVFLWFFETCIAVRTIRTQTRHFERHLASTTSTKSTLNHPKNYLNCKRLILTSNFSAKGDSRWKMWPSWPFTEASHNVDIHFQYCVKMRCKISLTVRTSRYADERSGCVGRRQGLATATKAENWRAVLLSMFGSVILENSPFAMLVHLNLQDRE